MVEKHTNIRMGEFVEFKKIPGLRTIAEKDLITGLFGKDIDLLIEAPTLKGKKGKTLLVERLFSLALDTGLRKKTSFLKVTDGDNSELEPVAMLNRQSFITELRKRIGFKEEIKDSGVPEYSSKKKFSIFQIDLAALRKADEALDSQKNSAGDYNLNLVASTLNEIVSKLPLPHGLNIDPKDIMVGRYGGDEFSVALIGDLSREKKTIEMISSLIRSEISKKFGYFKEKGEIKRKKLRLKDNKVDIISVPDGESEDTVTMRKLFLSFLKRGLILDEKQLKIEQEYFSKTHKNIDDYLKSTLLDNEQYTKLSLNEKIDYITSRHTELKIPFFLVKHLDGESNYLRQEKILHFIENYLSDPLLDEIVISRFDLPSHIRSGNFKNIMSYEIKLKEINDNLSYAYGDQIIIDLWKTKLRPILDDYVKEGRVRIGRFAGTIFIAETNEGLPSYVKNMLRNINKIQVTFKDKVINHSLGFSEADVTKMSSMSMDREISSKINEIFNFPTTDWLKNVFNRLFNNEQNYEEFKRSLIDTEGVLSSDNYFSLLTAKYFSSKRWEARMTACEEVFNLIANEGNQGKIDEIRKIFTFLKPKLNKKFIED